jgi:UDP-N-acetylglucosamine/UDP-N-acetylgalactosamine diphosphorylase
LFYCHIDNPLAQICDPQLIGYHLLACSEMTSQAVKKRAADEKVGNVVTIGGVTQIIEYSDLPAKYGAQTRPDGSLRLWAGNIGVHVFRRGFLERAAGQRNSLPFHRALKAVPHINADGAEVNPQSPNAIKFERFIFDLLPLAKNALVAEASAADAFAPVKNADGDPTDTPATAKAAVLARDAKLLRDAGARIADGVAVEVSPLWALDSAEAAAKLSRDHEITDATYFV